MFWNKFDTFLNGYVYDIFRKNAKKAKNIKI